MTPDASTPRGGGRIVPKVIAWVSWVALLIASFGLFVFATAVRNDVYSDRYYGHYPMSKFTVVMTTFPIWIVFLPLLWLPFIIAYQRQSTPKGIRLLPIIVSMFMAALVVFVLILCAGPPIQM